MAIKKQVLSPKEARAICPICNKPTGGQRPVCLYNPEKISQEEAHKCPFAKYAGKPVIQVHCDLCGGEIRGMRFIDGIHQPPPFTVLDKHVCAQCLKKPENAELRKIYESSRSKS